MVLGPGSWFSSVIPHLLVPELRSPRRHSGGPDGHPSTCPPKASRDRGLHPEMHLEVLATYAPDLQIDTVVADRASDSRRSPAAPRVGDLGAEVHRRPRSPIADGTRVMTPKRLARAYAGTFARGRIGPWR